MFGNRFKKISILALSFLIFANISPIFAEENQVKENQVEDILPSLEISHEEDELIQTIAVKKTKINDEKEIKNTLKKLDKYVAQKNLNGVSSLISDSFINNDGFSKDSYLKMLQKSWEMYPDLKGYTKAEKITIEGDMAQVYIKDFSKGNISNPDSILEKNGTVTITSESILFMQKYGNEWKLQSIYTVKENSILAYSDAQNIKMTLSAPNQVAQGTGYCAKLNVETPKNYIPFASISNDKIEYPPTMPDMVFKTPTEDGSLERMLTANSDNKNEYIVATIGITKPTISKDNRIMIKISGMAVVITRVNVINQKQEYSKI